AAAVVRPVLPWSLWNFGIFGISGRCPHSVMAARVIIEGRKNPSPLLFSSLLSSPLLSSTAAKPGSSAHVLSLYIYISISYLSHTQGSELLQIQKPEKVVVLLCTPLFSGERTKGRI
ncbi:unnamed protein product, partial [Discosporangium mesarthrocarpum]